MRAQMFAIGLGIALLLPLAVVTGFNITHAPPKWESLYDKDFNQMRSDAKSKEEKQRITAEEKRQKQQLEEADRNYEKGLFYVSFPVGIAAAVIGALLAARAVGAGLMFGGIILLAGGCYTYWDKMTAITRFASILIALAVFIVLGYLKGRGSHAPPEVARTEPIDRAQAA